MHKKKKLSAFRVRKLLNYDPDTGLFTHKTGPNEGQPVGCPNSNGYIVVSIDGRNEYAHRLAWLYVHGFWPRDIRHINGNRADNSVANLRDVSRSETMSRRCTGKNNRSGEKGVSKCVKQNKWLASICKNKVKYHLGSFKSLEDAVAARKAAELKYLGDSHAALEVSPSHDQLTSINKTNKR